MNAMSPQPPEPQPAAQPGKIRTWWHPLLASLLRWQLGSHYHLEEEISVGQKPLQIDGLNHPLLTLVSPTFLADPGSAYALLRQAGYTNLVVYLTQQIQQFRMRGEEFAMQHLGTDDELKQVLREIVATMSPEERLEGLSAEERVEGLSTEERLEGLSTEERLRGLTPEQLEQLRQLLEQRRPADGNRLQGSK
jgi:hypothetical protein